MKVFTVGLDQKMPRDDDTLSTVTEKNFPPPSYASNSPVPFHQPAIIVQRKSRGYKGILLIMLSVFLIALFALTISEIAYNRQRDENIFKLRWAELKHRMGNSNDAMAGGPFGFLHRNWFQSSNDQPISAPQTLDAKMENEIKPIIQQRKGDDEPTTPKILVNPVHETSTESSASNSNSNEIEPAGSFSNENTLRDARLMFLRKILQKIKKQAEQMGFDGTLQISVIEVEPQLQEGSDGGSSSVDAKRPLLGPSSLFNGFQSSKSENRMNGPAFSELPTRPLFMQNNDFEWRHPQQHPFEFFPSPQINNFDNPMFGRQWHRFDNFRQPPQMQQPQQMIEPTQVLSRPEGFWNSDFFRQEQQQQQQPQQNLQQNQRQPLDSERGDVDVPSRRFGDLLRDIIANRIQNFQQIASLNMPDQQQQQQTMGNQFPESGKQDRPQSAEWPKPPSLQNDFFRAPVVEPTSDPNLINKPTVEISSKLKETLVSGEINSENRNGNNNQNQPQLGRLAGDDWLVGRPMEKQESDQANGQEQQKKHDLTMPMISVMDDNENTKSKENSGKSKPDGIENLWQQHIPNVDIKTQDNKNKDGDQIQVQFQQPQLSFPHSPPFFFQVDDPNQQQSHTTT